MHARKTRERKKSQAVALEMRIEELQAEVGAVITIIISITSPVGSLDG
jgi:hypothetical protein